MASYTSSLAEALAPGLLERFDRYVRVDTQSARDRTRSPSTPGQLELAAVLAGELAEIGLTDAAVDDNGYVTATLPPSGGGDAATVIGLVAHMDTSPDAPRGRRRAGGPPRLRRRRHRAAAQRHDAGP